MTTPIQTSQAPEGTIIHLDLPYVTNGHPRQKLDLYLPQDEKNAPLIVWVHGGAWRAGSKENDVPLAYVATGYAVASINYRLSQHAIFPAQIEDCKAAIRWLRAHAQQFNLDPNHFGAWGSSAGGHLVALLGVTGNVQAFDVGENLHVSSQVQAVVDYFGPTDFSQMDNHRLPDGMIHNTPDSPESMLIGGDIQTHPDRVAQVNPITYLTKAGVDQFALPPFLIVHGDQDPIVPWHQSQLLEVALKSANASVALYTVKGGGHGGFTDPKVPELTRQFFARIL